MIRQFSGKYRFLSNFWPCKVQYDGIIWPTAEHFYQSTKTDNQQQKKDILNASTPGRAKRLGRRVDLSPNWEQTKDDAMLLAVRLKFNQNPDLAKLLMATGDSELIEGNQWHDNYWGACSCSRCQNRVKNNRLGEILMRVRNELNKATRQE